MHTSNHSAGRGPRVYNLTSAGSRLARYLDYVDTRPGVSPDINFADRANPSMAAPVEPEEPQWDEMPRAHIQTPEETDWAIRQLMDAGATFPNFQAVPEQYDLDRAEARTPDPDLSPEDRDTEDPDMSGDDDDRCPFCGTSLEDAYITAEGLECAGCGESIPGGAYGDHSPERD